MTAPAFPDEKSQLALLESDASLNDKATACQQLAIIGTSDSIPALTGLLDHEQLSSHALIALEAIGSPGVSKALIAALPRLEGLRLSGVVLSLGRLRETKAIAPLREFTFDPSAGVQREGIAALGLIASPESGALLELVLKNKADPLRTVAGHAALIAAERLQHEGHTTETRSLLQTTLTTIPEGPVHKAADKLLHPLGQKKENKNMKALLLMMSIAIATSAMSFHAENPQWIWQADDGPKNTWVAFRKEFDLKKVPEAVVANISTDTKYWLWINGEMVLFEGGLARGPHPKGIYFDEVDIQPFLKPGKNSLAILVWYWGKTAKTHDDSGNGGLLFSADLGETVLTSDKTWKLKAHPAYDPKSKGLNRSANRPNAMDVKYDARKAMGDWTSKGWNSAGFSMDASWQAATEKGQSGSVPWGELVKRPIPLWNDRGLADYESLRVGEKKITLPYKTKGEKKTVIWGKLPMNKQITPYLKVKSGGGKTIEIGMDNRFNLINAQYTTKSGEQSFETYSWMNGHEVKYEIPPDVEVLELKYRWTGLGEIVGTFECSDPFFQRLWWMAANTLYICTRDCYMDCPDRERGLWIGDVADQTGAVFYTLGEPGRLLLKKGIDNTIAYQNSDIIQGLAPGFGDYRGKSSELTSQSLQYIAQGIWQYYFNTGDKATLAYAYPSVLNYLKLWKMQPNGLPEIRKGYASWIDWGPNPDRNPVEVCWYHMALNAAKKMAVTLGENQDVAWYDERIKSIAENFDKIYWRDGYYGSEGAAKDERVSALAILTGLADKSKYDDLLKNVLITEYNASPHMEWIVEEAMILASDTAAALNRMKERYTPQVENEERTTLDEFMGVKKGGTYNHAWNAPNYVLSRYIAGISATDVAWQEYQVLPDLVHMTAVKQVVPSVQGDIVVEIKRTDNLYGMKLSSPEGTTAIVGFPKASITPKSIEVNGSNVWKNGAFSGSVSGITWNGEDDKYLKFNVAPGTWTFSAVAQ